MTGFRLVLDRTTNPDDPEIPITSYTRLSLQERYVLHHLKLIRVPIR